MDLKELLKNKDEIIRLKKAALKFCDIIDVNETTSKAYNYEANDDLENGIINRKIVANTYGWLDSHDDVHIQGIFTKSINENAKNVIHLHDHIYQLDAKVGVINTITEEVVNLQDLGLNKQGSTTCLIIDSNIKKSLNEKIFSQYLSKEINQHSVGMRYVNLFLCVNDTEYKEEYANWQRYSSQVINIEKAIEQGYFWAVTEAKLIEVSCVIAGSNELTPTFEPLKFEPTEVTQKHEDTQFTELLTYINNNLKI